MSVLQNIFRDNIEKLPNLPHYKKKAVFHIATCKTSEAGAVILGCKKCNLSKTQYRSCGSRMCNNCGHLKKELWVNDRLDELLPVPYHMVTFTIPDKLRCVFKYNETVCYNLMFKAVAESIKSVFKYHVSADAEVGFTQFLHTWTQQMLDHPHSHCIIPAGGLSHDGFEWIPCEKNYFLPAKALGALFRAKLSEAIVSKWRKGKIVLPPRLQWIKTDGQLSDYSRGKFKRWVVHITKSSFDSEHLVDYLSRYVQRSVISDDRIENYDGDRVTIRYKNRETNAILRLDLKSEDFIKRYTQHILPRGLTRIRYYGFMSCRYKSKKIAIILEIFNPKKPEISIQRLIKSLEVILLKLAGYGYCKNCPDEPLEPIGTIEAIRGKYSRILFPRRKAFTTG
ncbi:MAG: transposase [Planctomycetes bacterium]|nr:transposase [Planctomycetota bacterium]